MAEGPAVHNTSMICISSLLNLGSRITLSYYIRQKSYARFLAVASRETTTLAIDRRAHIARTQGIERGAQQEAGQKTTQMRLPGDQCPFSSHSKTGDRCHQIDGGPHHREHQNLAG